MTVIDVIGRKPDKINFFPSSMVEEIHQNLVVLLSTVVGSVPLDRNLGIDVSFIDAPTLRAMMKARIFLLETIQEYEPRVEVRSIDFVADESSAMEGKLYPIVKVRIRDEYIA